MSSVRLPIFHVLFTNAPGEDGQGFRCLQVGFGGTAEDRKPIDEWLKRLEPAEGSRQGWATNSFKVAGVRCAVLAVISPSFSRDESERGGGRLAHALVLPLEEGKPIGHFGRALYEMALDFLEASRSLSSLLRNYLEGCRVHNDIEIGEIRPDELDRLVDLLPVVQALVDAGSESSWELPLPSISDEESLPEKILAASAALPPSLRLGLHWRVGLQPDGEGFVVRPGRAGEMPPASRFGAGQAYTDDLWRRLQERQADELARIVNENWDIKQWKPLPASRPQLAVEAPATPKKTEPTKRWNAPGSARSASAPAPRQSGKSAADYDREREILYDEIREYIDQRFRHLSTPPPLALSLDPKAPGSPVRRWLGARRPEMYLFLVVLFLLPLYCNLKPLPVEIAYEPPSTNEDAPRRPSPNPPSASLDPNEEWESFVESKPLAAVSWFRAVATHEGLEPQQVPYRQRASFGGWAQKLEAGKSLTNQEITQSRIGLFEYVHARWARQRGVANPGEYQVTLMPEEVAPHLEQLAEDLGLTGQMGSDPHPNDPKIQAAVVLQWIDRHPRS